MFKSFTVWFLWRWLIRSYYFFIVEKLLKRMSGLRAKGIKKEQL